jgi:Rps23 Pro-64 3,4-dihydroxylase Tpa1-like proline 4-hydroxylase
MKYIITNMMDFTENREQLASIGYTIIDNFLPIEIAEEVYNLYASTPQQHWELFDQNRPDHYKHVFHSPNPFLPTEEQIYSAKFWRSKHLENTKTIQDILKQYFHSNIGKISGVTLTAFDDRCYQLTQGNYYRTHIDDYAGIMNSIYYVNKQWSWDWGGILNVCSHTDHEYNQAIFPKFNRLVLLYNEKFRSPHYVNQVSEFASVPRYSIVSFNK